jgi:cellulose synthase operon protein C
LSDRHALPPMHASGLRYATAVAAYAVALSVAVMLPGCSNEQSTAAPSAPESTLVARGVDTRIIEYKNTLQRDPFSAEARFGLGSVFLEKTELRAADSEFSRALELGMDPNIVLPQLARTWILMGRSRALIETHGNTRLSNPSASAAFKAELALAYINRGDPKKAREVIDSALKDDPTSPAANVVRAQFAMSERRVDDALRVLDEIFVAHPGAADAWKLKGDILLLAKNDATAATAAYEQALRANPRHMPSHATLIAMALGSNDLATARTRLNSLMDVAPGYLQTRFFEAKLAVAKGDFKAARDVIQQAVVDYPTDLRSLVLAGEVELKMDALRAAEEYLTRAMAIAPNMPRVRHLMAQTYLRLGTPEKATAILDPMVTAKRADPIALALSAEAALQSGLPLVAMRLFERAAAAAPGDPKLRTALALTRIAKGEVEAGFHDLEAAAAADRSTYTDMALLSARLRSGDMPAALKAAQGIARKLPGNPLPLWTLGGLQLRTGNVAMARNYFEQALELDKAFVPASLSLAELDVQARDPDKARRRFQSVLAIDPNHQEALLALAEIRARAGEPAGKVTESFEMVVRLHPTQPQPRLSLINHLIRSGNGTAALTAAQDATGVLPTDLAIVEALGRAQLAVGETAQALTTFRKIVTAQPRAPEPHLLMADVYMGLNQNESAMESLKQAVALKPNMIAAQAKLTGLATVAKNWPEALRVARNVQRLQPKAAAGFHLEGLVYAAQKQWDLAIAAFRNASQRGQSSELTLQLHSALMASGKKDDAARLAAQWLAKNPADNAFLKYMGDLALVNRDYAAAELRYRAIVATDERDADALNNLAWVLIEQSKPEALAVASKAAELQPKRADILDTLSAALAKAEQLPAALENQKKAVALAPEALAMRLHLARIAIKARDYPLAKVELDKLSALGKSYPQQADVWQLRQQLR